MTSRYVAYLRVSTAKQGQSGLGLDAQASAIAQFMATRPGSDIIRTYTETESGKHDDRPLLTQAMAYASATGATLLIAKLDRLSRNAAFLMNLRDKGVPFIAADMPDANDMTVGIMAVIAEGERKAISKRTREALQVAKERLAKLTPAEREERQRQGQAIRLGNPNGARHLIGMGNAAAAQGARDKATAYAHKVKPVLDDLHQSGITSATSLAKALNTRSVPTSRGGLWTAQGVINIMSRL